MLYRSNYFVLLKRVNWRKKLYQTSHLQGTVKTSIFFIFLMNFLSLFSISLIFFSLIGCSAPKGLEGIWAAQHQECLSKDNSGIFKDLFTKEKQYILEFKANKEVNLIYLDLSVSADFFVGQIKQEEKEVLRCDVVAVGTYSYGILGSLHFNFANDETGAYQIKQGKNCETELDIKFKSLPENSPYIGDPSVSVDVVDAQTLHLGFSGSPICKNDKMITVFNRQ